METMLAMTSRDQIIRTAIHAIRNGTSVEVAITNAVDASLELQGLRSALQEGPLRAIVSLAEIDELAHITANRRNPAAPAEPTGKHPDSPWWGKGEK